MKIMATVKERHDIELSSKIDELKKYGVYDYRFNYAKVRSEKEEIMFCENINKLKFKHPDINIMIDIPYPGRKKRLICKNRKILIEKGKEYVLWLKHLDESIIEDNEMFLNSNLNSNEFYIGQKIFYDMGESCFKVVEIIDDYRIRIKALNTYQVYSDKGITTSNIEKNGYYDIVDRLINRLDRVNAFALSFIEELKDLEDAKRLKNKYSDILFISKVETEKAIKNLHCIAKFSDQVMLGRGDLIVNSQTHRIMEYELKTKKICNECNCEFMFASGFLNSFINNYLPSHSDVIDITLAINLNPDYLILNTDLVFSHRFSDAIGLINNIKEEKRDRKPII
jgi:pyruvate kinase